MVIELCGFGTGANLSALLWVQQVPCPTEHSLVRVSGSVTSELRGGVQLGLLLRVCAIANWGCLDLQPQILLALLSSVPQGKRGTAHSWNLWSNPLGAFCHGLWKHTVELEGGMQFTPLSSASTTASRGLTWFVSWIPTGPVLLGLVPGGGGREQGVELRGGNYEVLFLCGIWWCNCRDGGGMKLTPLSWSAPSRRGDCIDLFL